MPLPMVGGVIDLVFERGFASPERHRIQSPQVVEVY